VPCSQSVFKANAKEQLKLSRVP